MLTYLQVLQQSRASVYTELGGGVLAAQDDVRLIGVEPGIHLQLGADSLS